MPTFTLTTVTIGSNSDTIREPTLMKGTLPATVYTLGYVTQYCIDSNLSQQTMQHTTVVIMLCKATENKMCGPKCQHNVRQLQYHETELH